MRNLAVCIFVEYFESFQIVVAASSKKQIENAIKKQLLHNNQILFIFGADDVCLLEMLQIGGFFYEFPGITNKNLKKYGNP